MREVGAYSPNRILELEDENTIGSIGDIHTMNSTYTTLDRIGAEPVAAPVAAPAPEPEEDDEASSARNAFQSIMNVEPANV
jgi:hypothetical protein